VILKNISSNSIISTNVKNANSFVDQVFGLLNKRNPRFLIFNTRFGIHTIFMKTPIDVILFDSNNYIVKIKRHLLPNRLFFYHPKNFKLIEMPKDTIDKFHIRINDKISIE